MANLQSPFQCGGSAKAFADKKFTTLTIRVNDASPTAKVYVKLGGTTASSSNADFFLNAGEALDICGDQVKTGADISIIDASNDPLIFWSMT